MAQTSAAIPIPAARRSSPMLKPEMIVEYRAVFSSFDKNGDGRVSAREFGDVMAELGFNMSDSEVRTIIAKVDRDQNGELDFDEFIGIVAHVPAQVLTDANLRKAFHALDKDNSGYLTRDEVFLALQRCGGPTGSAQMNDDGNGGSNSILLPTERQVDQFMARVDTNRDGKINYEEFCALVRGGDRSGANDNKAKASNSFIAKNRNSNEKSRIKDIIITHI